MQINLSVQSLRSHTLHDDLLARVMNDIDIISADLAHLNRGNVFILQPYAAGPEQKSVQYCDANYITQSCVCFEIYGPNTSK